MKLSEMSPEAVRSKIGGLRVKSDDTGTTGVVTFISDKMTRFGFLVDIEWNPNTTFKVVICTSHSLCDGVTVIE